jgi:hypothetical protein
MALGTELWEEQLLLWPRDPISLFLAFFASFLPKEFVEDVF